MSNEEAKTTPDGGASVSTAMLERTVTSGQIAAFNMPTLKVPSVFDGDVPFLTFNVEDGNGGSRVVGKLWGRGGVLSFEGDADESAMVFFRELIERNREFLMRSNA